MTPTEKEIETLIKLFVNAREQLLETIINYKGVGTKVYANTVLLQLQETLKQLEAQTGSFAASAIPREYEESLNEVYDYFKRNKLQMRPPASFARIHSEVIYGVARELQYNIGRGLEQAGRQVTRYVNTARDNALRKAGLEATGEKFASGSTLKQMQDNLIGKLQSEGFMTVQYGQGKGAYQVPIDAYAKMVARSTTREAGNLARETQLTENGYDLMKMSTHYPTCDLCATLQGRVYSISGKDKRFPALSVAFKSGYRNVHPNCRHVMTYWVEDMQEPEEMQEAVEESNKPFEDTRPEQEKALYSKQQTQNRQLRQDRYQHERYKARLGEDAPKTFSAFRKEKKANGPVWQFTQLDYKRRSKLLDNPALVLPNAATATAAEAKFTKYLFSSASKSGSAKGIAFTSRLGYNVGNWQDLQSEILKRAPLYPSKHILTDDYGVKFEQKIVIYGKNRTPANVVVGWREKDGVTWMTSCYIKEV